MQSLTPQRAKLGLLATLFALAVAAIAGPTTAKAAYPSDLDILTHNVQMLPVGSFGNVQRANLIKQAGYIRGHDVVVLQEMFVDSQADIIMNALKSEYPYQTPVLGSTRCFGWSSCASGDPRLFAISNGGVAILSKYPIVKMNQHIFREHGCIPDYVMEKGFVHARIKRASDYYNVVSTHAQAEECFDGQNSVPMRTRQFQEIAAYVNSKISTSEATFIAGDLNVIRGSAEYAPMLATLGVAEPAYTGHPYTYDTSTNSYALIACFYCNDAGNIRQWLDYVLPVSAGGRPLPPAWSNDGRNVKSPSWYFPIPNSLDPLNVQYNDFSDHYPVLGSG